MGSVDAYVRLRAARNRFRIAQEMVENFIHQGSIYELNISDEVRQTLLRKIETVGEERCPRDLFVETASVVFGQLQLEAHVRYVSSREVQQAFSLLVASTSLGKALDLLDAKPNALGSRSSEEHHQDEATPRSAHSELSADDDLS